MIRLSRPNRATNHGSPAAGTNFMWSGALDRQSQCGHVVDRLSVSRCKGLVGGLDLQNAVLPKLLGTTASELMKSSTACKGAMLHRSPLAKS